MMGIPREIRIRQLHDFFDGKWHTKPQSKPLALPQQLDKHIQHLMGAI